MTSKIYCFVDETGQDTKGLFFIVVVIILPQHAVGDVENALILLEKSSGKGIRKWTKSQHMQRIAYLRGVLQMNTLRKSIYYAFFSQSMEYTKLTALTVAKSIIAYHTTKPDAYIVIDGLNNAELLIIRTELKKLSIKYSKIRGMKDEQSPLLRLADTVCGFLHDARHHAPYAMNLMKEMEKKMLVTEI